MIINNPQHFTQIASLHKAREQRTWDSRFLGADRADLAHPAGAAASRAHNAHGV